MKALVYARYSTHKQDNGVSIENQIARCREYATYRGLDIVDIIQDLAVSGGVNKGRAGFMELLHRAEQGECDLILTYDLTRLSREMLSLLALERLLNEWEVELHTVEGQVDTATPEGFMSFAMRAFMGEMERRTVKHRTRRAMQHLKGNGRVYNHTPYGWKREGDTLVELESEQRVISQVNEWYQGGATLAEIQRSLKTRRIQTREGKGWQPQQVKRLIQGYQQTYRRANREMETATKAFIQAIA